MGSSQLKLGRTTTMKFLVAVALAAVGVAAEPGFYGGYRGYGAYYGGHHGFGGYHHLGKRSADAKAVATADAEPGFYGGYYGGYLGGFHGRYYGGFRGGYRGYGGYGHYLGKRSADAEAV